MSPHAPQASAQQRHPAPSHPTPSRRAASLHALDAFGQHALSRHALLSGLAAALVELIAVAYVASSAHGTFPWPAVSLTTLVAALVGWAISIAAQRRDTARLAPLRAVLVAANAGELSGQLHSTRGDAAGAIEREVDTLLQRMVTVVGTVQKALDLLRVSSAGVAHVHKDMLDTAELTAGQAYDAGVSASGVSDNIQVVAAATEELIATVNDIARHATHAADVATMAAEQGQVADAGVQGLTHALDQVEGISQVISAIASQTHLLALNAKIEAARAGEAGAGFAVVALEVKELSRATAEATEQVRAIVSGIHEGSGRASAAINEITQTMALICQNASSIASAVTQQTATTREIGRVSVSAAEGAADISQRVTALHDRAREVTYVGAQTDAAGTETFAAVEAALLATIEGLHVGGFEATIEAKTLQVDQEALNRMGTTTADGVTTIVHDVIGSDLNQFNYTGAWLHGNGYETDPGGDAYCSVPGDEVTVRFVGTSLRFTGCMDAQQGIAEVWVDGQQHTLVDFYSPVRAHTVLWESPELPRGEHIFHVRVSPTKNPASRYFWVSVAKVEITH